MSPAAVGAALGAAVVGAFTVGFVALLQNVFCGVGRVNDEDGEIPCDKHLVRAAVAGGVTGAPLPAL